MTNPTQDQISRSRMLLGNPWAYLDGDGQFAAAPIPETTSPVAPALPPDLAPGVQPTADQISRNRRLFENQYAFLDGDGGFAAAPLPREDLANSSRAGGVDRIEVITGACGIRKDRRISAKQIEHAARSLQREIWLCRKDLWPHRTPEKPVDILDPGMALHFLGYKYDPSEPLGQFASRGGLFEVAGVIDRINRIVRISPQFSPEVRNFTGAHELGHAVLHQGTQLHRDRALDGSMVQEPRDHVELEADKFAAFFLMPAKVVRDAFKQAFGVERLSLTDDVIFALDPRAFVNRVPCYTSGREFARALASTEQYSGRRLRSLSSQFFVSVEAMAIRLEELDLFEF